MAIQDNRSFPLYGQSGFTLVEMAIVVVIAGIIISIVATVLPSLIQSSKVKKAQAILERADYTLQGYITANGRLPCPDTNGDGVEDRTPGSLPPSNDTCTSYVGNLPFATLGISSGNDVWQNPIRYGVYEGLIRTTQSGLCSPTPCALCLSGFVSAPNGTWLRTSTGTDTVVGFVLASGGPKDLDTDGSFFDGRNANAPGTSVFESPDMVVSPTYDDLVRAGALTYLQGRLCTGGGGGGGGTGNSEICGDVAAQDEDGDGLANCADPDCLSDPACAVGPSVTITTATLPSGFVNSAYNTTIAAHGGVPPYNWTIDNDGGFSGLFLHTYTGQVSGTLNQCPGTYSPFTVDVDDTTTPAATSDSRNYSMEVQADLAVSRTSGSGIDISWDTATQEETFQANGGHLGDITWTLSTGGADGFTWEKTGSNSCRVKKDGETTTGVGPYNFVLTAVDESCTASNTAQITFTVTIPASGTGAAAPYTVGMEAEWRFDECTAWDGTSYDVEDNLGNPLHHGRRIGNVAGVSNGMICRAASFDGGSARIVSDVLTGADIMAFSDQVTLSAWFKSPGGGGGYPRLIEFSDAAGLYTRSTALAYDRDGSIRAWVTSEAGVRGGQIDYASTTYDDNEWHHAVYTYSTAGGGKLYIDGALKQTRTDNPTNDIHDAETFVIGGYYPDGSHGFLGLIDEVAVFQRELTATEVGQLFGATRGSCPGSCYSPALAEYQMENAPWAGTAGEVYDTGSGGNNGVAALAGTGALPTQTDTSGGQVCRAGVLTRVDGTNGGYLDLGDPSDLDPNTRPWTISAWIYWDGSSGENIIYNKENLYEARVVSGYVNYAWRPHWYWDGGTSFPVTANTWTHVTTTYEGTEQVLYKDGVRVYSRAESGAIGTNSSKLLIGARGSATPFNFFGGMIDEVKIYDRALSQSEIKAIVGETRTCP